MWHFVGLLSFAPTLVSRDHIATPAGRGRALKALSAPLAHPIATAQWLRTLRRNKLARELRRRDPSFTIKPMLRYLNASYQFAERVSCLAHHYNFVIREINHAALREIYFGPGVCLAEFFGKSGSQYRLILSTYTIPHNEGELLLKLTTSDGEIISMVIFSVGVDGDGCSRIEVGAIQGARRQHPELSKAASRDFYSMHPLRLLIAMLYGFARTCKIERIVCVGTTNQVGYSEDPSNHFRTDYDHLWLELGGMPASPGFYELPREMLHGQADRNSHGRRSRRRSELKRTILEALEQTLRAFRR